MSTTVMGARESFLEGRRAPLLDNKVFGMLLFVVTEAMFFVALISAYLVIRAAQPGPWMPPRGAMLPQQITMINTAVLFLSGVFAFLAAKKLQAGATPKTVFPFLLQAAALGFIFVLVQGYEWLGLIAQGMSMKSGIFGACFYLLVGSHGFHALCGSVGLLCGLVHLKRGTLTTSGMWALFIFWSLIVGIWPFLYGLAYFA